MIKFIKNQPLSFDIKALDIEGIDAILSVSPSYNKPTQEGIYQHYKIIAESKLNLSMG